MIGADAELILATLEIVAERRGDPTPDVYARLFAVHPELEALFLMDRDGGVRASMMQQALECIVDHAGDRGLSRRRSSLRPGCITMATACRRSGSTHSLWP